MAAEKHRALADAAVRAIPCGVLTISDTRTPDTDTSGEYIRTALVAAGHVIVHHAIVRDEPDQIAARISDIITAGAKVLITSGGTGIARRDSTFEVIDRLLEKRLPGFGEIFRVKSFEQIGPAAMLSRATAGVYRGTLVFCLPGALDAVQLALPLLIVPELRHLVWETIRQ